LQTDRVVENASPGDFVPVWQDDVQRSLDEIERDLDQMESAEHNRKPKTSTTEN
jgi:hypothetical protein